MPRRWTVKEARRRRYPFLTQAQFITQRDLKISRSSLSRIENCRRVPSKDVQPELARALRISVSRLKLDGVADTKSRRC
mgnify:CR=1 FL=1